MLSVKTALLVAAAAVSLGKSVAHAETTTTQLANSGAWEAVQFHFDSGTTSCVLITKINDTYVLLGVGPGEDRIKLIVRYDDRSAPKPFLTNLDITFDGTDRWTVGDHNASVDRNTVDTKITLAASASFVHAFTAGATMKLTMPGTTPITVSLARTTAVWGPFMDCVKGVSPTVVASITNPTAFAAVNPPAPQAAPVVAARQPDISEVALLTDAGVKHVRGVAGSNTAVLFVLDSGAAAVQIPRAAALRLIQEGAMVPTGERVTFIDATGRKTPQPTYLLRSLTVGERTVTNVECNITDAGDPLLGQSFLGRLSSWSLDNARQMLVLGAPNA